MEHIAIYLEREKIKVLGLVGPMEKMGCFPTFMVHLGIMGMMVSLPPCFDAQQTYGPFGPSTLVVCGTMRTFGMIT